MKTAEPLILFEFECSLGIVNPKSLSFRSGLYLFDLANQGKVCKELPQDEQAENVEHAFSIAEVVAHHFHVYLGYVNEHWREGASPDTVMSLVKLGVGEGLVAISNW